MTCEACRRPALECECHECCRLCACLTNHTTAQHEQAAIRECSWCGEPLKDGDEFDGDPEATMHQTCAYEWRDDRYDIQAKDEGGQG